MSLQTIINKASSIEFHRGRIVASTMSRSQRVKTATRNAVQPWYWKVTPPGALKWSTSRSIIEAIDYSDRDTEYTLQLTGKAGSYIIGYQGALTPSQLNEITISSFTGSTLILKTLPTVASSTVMFRAGDIIQPKNSRYPYTVVNTQVLRGSGSTVTLAVNRAVIASENINTVDQGLNVGTDVSWRMILLKKPSYSVIPYDILRYNGDFELVEKII